MTVKENFLHLTDADCFSSGTHRKVYRYPGNDKILIKIAFNKDGESDMAREMYIRNKLLKNNIRSRLLPQYHGMVKTNLGKGYLFEYIKDADGTTSRTLEDYLADNVLLEKEYDKVLHAMQDFKRCLFAENIVIMDLFPINIILQRLTDGSLRPQLINDMSSAALISLEYYLAYFNRKRTLRRWQRFIKYIQSTYSSRNVEALLENIK